MTPSHQAPSLSPPSGRDAAWVAAFHEGRPAVIEECYRDHYDTIVSTLGTLLCGADKETVVHEVFFRLLSLPELRRNFVGGHFAPWLLTVARNHALDFKRRVGREQPLDVVTEGQAAPAISEETLDAKRLVDDFRANHLPPQWAPVFEARFIRQLSQREAARALGLHRTTLAFRELRIRRLLRRVLLKKGIFR
jgi:RNA polymerase sigma-70 factor, ECF subfamily